MRVTTLAPDPRLAPFVRRYTIVEADETTTRVLLPETGLIVGLRYRGAARDGAIRMPDASLAGMRDTARRMTTEAGGGVVLAMFRPGAAAAFFAEPLHELFGATLPLDALAPRDALDRATDALGAAAGDAARAAVLESFLLARLDERRRDPLVAAALATIAARRGLVRAGDLARELGLSRDRFEKRFRRSVGTTPKQLASLVRVRRALALVAGGAPLSQAALDAGYVDQSHFTRALRRVTGEPPARFFQTVDHC